MYERFDARDRRFVVACIAVALVCGFIAWRYFGRAFPEASIDFKVNRAQSEDVAATYLRQLALQPSGYKHAAVFDYDEETKLFLERELGLEKAQQVYGRQVRLWRWSHRWFKPLQKEEFRVDVTTLGEIAHFERQLPEEAPGARLAEAPARRIAEAFLLSRMRIDPAGYDFVEATSAERKQRVDHVFTWKRHGFDIHGATYRMRVQVSGDVVTSYEEFLRIPDTWQDDYKRLRSRNDTAAAVAQALLFLTYLAMLGVLVLRIRDRDVRWHIVLGFGAVTFALQLLAALNDFQTAQFQYSTEDSYASFVTHFLLVSVLGSLALAGVIMLLTASAEPVYRQHYPNKISLSSILSRRGLRTRSFFHQVLLGLTLTLFFAAYQTGFYILATRLGAWAPLEVPYSNMLNTAFPWAVVLFTGFFPAAFEEFPSRMFSIPLLDRMLSRAGMGRGASVALAVVASSYIWGFAHANYPNQPFYIRGLEVGTSGVIVSLVMLRWGILATLVWHYTVDAFYTSLLLLRSGNTYFVVSGAITAGLMLVPLVLCVVSYRRRGGFEPETGLHNADETAPLPEPSQPAAPPPTPIPMHTPVPRRRIVVVSAAAAALLLLYGVTVYEPGEGIVFRSERQQAQDAARAYLRDQGGNPATYRMATSVESRYDPEVGRYVLERLPLRNLNELYSTYLRTPIWRVRFFRPEQREEYIFNLPVNEVRQPVARAGPSGEPAVPLWAFDHTLPDSAAGDSLSLDEARARAERFLRERGVDLSGMVLKEAGSEHKPKRVDHTFEWEIPDSTLGDAGIRYLVIVRGGQVAGLRPYMHLPESWLREYRKQPVLQQLLFVTSRVLLGVWLVFLVTLFVLQVRARRFPWRAALLWGAAVAATICAVIPLYWNSVVLMRYDTAIPYQLFVIGVAIVGVLLPLLMGLGAAIVVGTTLSLRPEVRLLLDGGYSRSYLREAAILALVGVALLLGLHRLGAVLLDYGSRHLEVRELLLLPTAARPLAWLDLYLPLLRNGVYALGALALTATVGRDILRRNRSIALLAGAVILFAAVGSRDPQQFVLKLLLETARAGAFLVLLVYLFRDNVLAYVLAYLVSSGLSTSYLWIQQPAASLRNTGLVLATLVALTLVAVMRLASRAARQTGAATSPALDLSSNPRQSPDPSGPILEK